MCGKTYWIHSLLQIVTYECTTAQINGAKPSTIDAWQCFSSNIRDYIFIYIIFFFFFFFNFCLSPSLSPFWLDFWNREYTFVVLFVLNGYCVVMLWKKKKVNKKQKKLSTLNCNIVSQYYCFTEFCDQLNAAVKNITNPKVLKGNEFKIIILIVGQRNV